MGALVTDVPRSAFDYSSEDLELVKAGCLTVAVKLAGLMSDIVIVGGYVPTLLIDSSRAREEHVEEDDAFSRHVGTRDLDLAFSVALLDDDRYSEVATQLRQAGFVPDENSKGNPTPQRWRFKDQPTLKLDFLIPPLEPTDEGGKSRHLAEGFAATVIPGLSLAYENFIEVELVGKTLRGAEAKRKVRVCTPAVFLVLKGLAIDKRGKDKDEYDVFYLIRNHPDGVRTIAADYARLLREGSVKSVASLPPVRGQVPSCYILKPSRLIWGSQLLVPHH